MSGDRDWGYTRRYLKESFGIKDATINNGVFRPKGMDAVWLFVTERKTPDRVQYQDRLDGDVLYWQGQLTGRTDRLISEDAQSGLEILVFYRKSKNEFAGAGFRFEGPFQYETHSGSKPTSFVLRRAR